jgi:hypothetical protein
MLIPIIATTVCYILGFATAATITAGKMEDMRLEFMAEIEKARSERN